MTRAIEPSSRAAEARLRSTVAAGYGRPRRPRIGRHQLGMTGIDTPLRPTPESLGDAALVARCRTGDPAAWRALVERYSRYVYAIAVRAYRLDADDAEEVFQEVFARTYQQLDRLRDDAAIRPWIGQLTRRLAVDRLRAAKRERPLDAEAVDGEEATARLDRIHEALAVRQALGSLNESCQELLDRFFARDESYRSIAETLGLPMGTVASRLSRCLSRLREVLEG
jgi:RNA polymerase sigma factor (sigma-70 family)